jgi:hypothetical protein
MRLMASMGPGAQVVAPLLQMILRQPVVIENRPGLAGASARGLSRAPNRMGNREIAQGSTTAV